ncbi:MAG: PAS domain S-box protein [Gelidibacter sp.]
MKDRFKILYLEDIPTDIELVEKVIKEGKIQLEKLVVNNKVAFEKALEDFTPDIVLSSNNLTYFGPMEAMKIVKQKSINTPFIILASTLSEEYEIEILKAGVDDYFLKTHLLRLPQAIKNAIHKSRMEAELDNLIGGPLNLNAMPNVPNVIIDKTLDAKIRDWNIGANKLFGYPEEGTLDQDSASIPPASSRLHIAVVDSSGNIIAANKGWEKFAKTNGKDSLGGITKGSNYFEVCLKLMAKGDVWAEPILKGILSVFNKEVKTFKIEFPCHFPTEQLWLNLSVTKFGDDDSKVLISHQNITKRKIAENNFSDTSIKLKNTLFHFNSILDASLDVICTINADWEFVNVSAASQSVWGYTPEELIGTNFMRLVYKEDVNITSRLAENIFNGNQIPLFENRYVHKNGKTISLLWSVNWDENLRLACCIAKDVSEQKSLEKAIKNERDQFYDMFLKAPAAIGMLKGANHVFEMANPLYLQLIDKENIIGKTVAEVLPEVIDQGFIELLDQVYHTGKSYSCTEMLVKVDKEKNGEMTDFYINLIYQAYKNGNDEIEGIFIFLNDITEQIQSRKKIEESEKQYRQIVETAQEGIWMIDENSKTTFINKKMCQILGYTEEELLGKPHYEFMDGEGKKKTVTALKKRKNGDAETLDYSFISKQGKAIHTKVSANPIFDDLGNFKGSLGMVSDVTEKKHLETLLEKSNRLARIGSWEIDVVNETVFWSDITKEIREVEKDYVPKLNVGISYFQEGNDKDTISMKVQDCIENGTPWDEELQITTFKGNLKWVRTIGKGEFLNGNCIKIHGSFQDITDRKIAVEKVFRSEAKLKVAQQIAQVGSWEVDLVTNQHSWSNEFYRILGINKHVRPSYDAFIGFVLPVDRAMTKKAIEDAVTTYTDSSFQFRFTSKNGETGYASSEWKVEFDTNCKPIYIYGILRDLTKEIKAEGERVKMISEIVQRNSDLEQFSYIVSHNLRAPTANIIGFAEILQNETLTSKEQKELLNGLLSSTIRLDNIIRDINTILQSKSEVHEKKEIITLSKLIDDIMFSMSNLAKKHRVQIVTDFSEVDEFYSLKNNLNSIFHNLISNSIKYCRPGEPPRIEIKSRKEKGKIIFNFKDNGLGMDIKIKGDKIFKLYNRFHSHVEGKGMGLFMVKTHVESLGGKISVASKVNKGTEFTIIFKI